MDGVWIVREVKLAGGGCVCTLAVERNGSVVQNGPVFSAMSAEGVADTRELAQAEASRRNRTAETQKRG